MLHWIPKPIIDSIHIQSLLYLLLWFGVFNYKTCRNEAVAAGSPYRYPLWLARALNSAIYDVKWDYEGYRAIAKFIFFMLK